MDKAEESLNAIFFSSVEFTKDELIAWFAKCSKEGGETVTALSLAVIHSYIEKQVGGESISTARKLVDQFRSDYQKGEK